MTDNDKYVITEEQLHTIGFDIEREIFDEIHSNPLSEHDAEQCNTCKLKGKRSCIYHGYPASTIPGSCSYKLGIDCERSLHNLNGTGIDVWTKEHDAEIAKKATDKLVDEFKWMKPMCFKRHSADCDTRCAWVVRKRCIESLRGEP